MLEEAGVEVTREAGVEVWGKCPGHEARTGHEDRSPSWSLNTDTLAHFCFSCGYKGTLSTLIFDMTGEVPEDLEGQIQVESFTHKVANIRRREEEPESVPKITEWALENMLTHVPKRMLDLRWLEPEAADYYEIRWDRDMKQWVLPIRDFRGNLLGAQYRQKGAVQTLPLGIKKSEMFFGFKQACEHRIVAITESPLDAVRLYQTGLPAFSTLGAFVSALQIEAIARQDFDCVVIALDNDDAGMRARESLVPALKKRGVHVKEFKYRGLRDDEGRKAKDPGDVPDDAALAAAIARSKSFGFPAK